MAKSKAQASKAKENKAQRQATRAHHVSRQEAAERWTRLLILGGVIAVILIAAGVISFGWYQTHIKPLNKTVLKVGSYDYNLAALERRMRSTLKQSPTLKQSQYVLQLPDVTLLALERESKLLLAASQLNVSVTTEELAAEIRKRGSLADDVQPDVYAAEFRKQIEDSSLNESEYVNMVKAGLLDTKVTNYFTLYAPAEEPQVRGNYITFNDSTKAQQALTRIQAGEDFNTVAKELSSTAASAKPVTAVDWSPRVDRSALPTAIQDFLFSAEPNQWSKVINTGSSTYVLAQLLERDDHRALDASAKKKVADRELNKWLDGLDATLAIQKSLSQSDSTRALNDVL